MGQASSIDVEVAAAKQQHAMHREISGRLNRAAYQGDSVCLVGCRVARGVMYECSISARVDCLN